MNAPKVFVSVEELRARFNQGNYMRQAQDGSLRCCIHDECTPASLDESATTRSILLACSNMAEHRIFLAHCYLRLNEEGEHTIGGSGRPDPKWLFEDGIVYSHAPDRPLVAENDGGIR